MDARRRAGPAAAWRGCGHALCNNVLTHDARGYDTTLWNHMEDFSTLLLGETGTGKGRCGSAGSETAAPHDRAGGILFGWPRYTSTAWDPGFMQRDYRWMSSLVIVQVAIWPNPNVIRLPACVPPAQIQALAA